MFSTRVIRRPARVDLEAEMPDDVAHQLDMALRRTAVVGPHQILEADSVNPLQLAPAKRVPSVILLASLMQLR